MKELIVGLFTSRKDANNARRNLKTVGLENNDIVVIAKEEKVGILRSVRKHITGEGALTGGILGGLAGILVASIPVLLPGMGVLLIGPFVIFIGFAVGAVIGGTLGALVDLGVSTGQVKRYKKRIREGGVVLAAPLDEERIEEAQEIMETYKAEEQTVLPYRSTEEKIEVPSVLGVREK